MRKFRVKEVYKVTGWTTIEAENEEHARDLLDILCIAMKDFDDIRADWDLDDTKWSTFEEVRNEGNA